jgi:hypothetical protein
MPGTQAEQEAKWRERRRGPRLNSSIFVKLEWEAAEGQRARAETRTKIVGTYGCMLVLPNQLEVDQHVHVTNMANQQNTAGAVVWRGRKRFEGWEYGIELINPELNFWGLELA